MSTQLRNIGASVMFGDQKVEADALIEVDGDLDEELPDAYLIGKGDDARAYPKSQWSVAGAKTPTLPKPASPATASQEGEKE